MGCSERERILIATSSMLLLLNAVTGSVHMFTQQELLFVCFSFLFFSFSSFFSFI